MCPVIVRREGKPWFAIGASGGSQDLSRGAADRVVSHRPRHEPRDAFHQPRIDASGGEHVGGILGCRGKLKSALSEKFTVHPAELAVYPANFACPSAV